MEKKTMTYREAIQLYQHATEQLYDLAGVLRDYAITSEKNYWNESRRLTRDVSTNIQRLDNNLQEGRADMIIGFEFSTIKINGK